MTRSMRPYRLLVGSHAPCHILSAGVISLSYVSRTCHRDMRICQVARRLPRQPGLAGAAVERGIIETYRWSETCLGHVRAHASRQLCAWVGSGGDTTEVYGREPREISLAPMNSGEVTRR